MDQQHLQRLQSLRRQRGLSIRRLGERAGVTAAMISCIERGRNSPSLATLQKILAALGLDLASFFGAKPAPQDGPVFVGAQMRAASDAERNYTILFPKRRDIAVEMLDEYLYPAAGRCLLHRQGHTAPRPRRRPRTGAPGHGVFAAAVLSASRKPDD